MTIHITIDETHPLFVVVKFTIDGDGNCTPDELINVDITEISPLHCGVIVSGNGPIWLHAAISHDVTAPWIAHHDPRLGGAVVVFAGQSGIRSGSVIPYSD